MRPAGLGVRCDSERKKRGLFFPTHLTYEGERVRERHRFSRLPRLIFLFFFAAHICKHTARIFTRMCTGKSDFSLRLTYVSTCALQECVLASRKSMVSERTAIQQDGKVDIFNVDEGETLFCVMIIFKRPKRPLWRNSKSRPTLLARSVQKAEVQRSPQTIKRVRAMWDSATSA